MSTTIFGSIATEANESNIGFGLSYFCQGPDCTALPSPSTMECRPHQKLTATGCRAGTLTDLETINVSNADSSKPGGIFKITLTADGDLNIDEQIVIGGRVHKIKGSTKRVAGSGAGRTIGMPGFFVQAMAVLLLAVVLLPGAYASTPSFNGEDFGESNLIRRADSVDFNNFDAKQLPTVLLDVATAASDSTAPIIQSLALTSCSNQYLSPAKPWYREAIYTSVVSVCSTVLGNATTTAEKVLEAHQNCNAATIQFIQALGKDLTTINAPIRRTILLTAAYLATFSCKTSISLLSEARDSVVNFRKDVCGTAFSPTTWAWAFENKNALPCKRERPPSTSTSKVINLKTPDGRLNIAALDNLADPCPKCVLADWTTWVFRAGDFRGRALSSPLCSGGGEAQAVCDVLCADPCAVYKEEDYGHLRGWKSTSEYADMCGGNKCARGRPIERSCNAVCEGV